MRESVQTAALDRRGSGLSRAVERGGKKCVDGLDDQVFDCGGEAGGVPVEDHGEIGLVSAFAQDAPGWNVAGDVVAVGDDPEAVRVDLPLETQGVVDDHFAGKEDHGQIVAEAPGFDRVGDVGFERFAAVEACDQAFGEEAFGSGELGSSFEGGAVWGWFQREVELAGAGRRSCRAGG